MNEQYKDSSKAMSRQVCQNLGRLASTHNLTHEAIATQTGYLRPSITRLFSGKFAPHLDVVCCVLKAINDLSGQHFTLKDIDYQAE